jgi:hypothetical protein
MKIPERAEVWTLYQPLQYKQSTLLIAVDVNEHDGALTGPSAEREPSVGAQHHEVKA